MRRKMSKSAVLCAILLSSLECQVSAGQDYGACTTERYEPGRCVSIKECEPLLRILQSREKTGLNYVKRSQCPIDTSTPTVCCPRGESEDEDVTGAAGIVDGRISGTSNGNYGPPVPPVCGLSNAELTRVVNGVPARPGNWPWAALLRYRSKSDPERALYLCGGTLISSRHVLTAGHCVYKRRSLYMVRLGEYDISSDSEIGAEPFDAFIERRTVHPDYDPVYYTNDVAVLKLNQEVSFSEYVRPLCLPVNDVIEEKQLSTLWPIVIGWGAVHYNGYTSPILRQFQSPVVREEDCRQAYKAYGVTIDERVLCAGYAHGTKDACQGDSGGAMMTAIGDYWYSIGIISYGFRCAVPGFPGVYTKTSAYMDFIKSALN